MPHGPVPGFLDQVSDPPQAGSASSRCVPGPREGSGRNGVPGPACGQRPQHEVRPPEKEGQSQLAGGTGIFLGQASCLEECWAASGVAPPCPPPKCLWRGCTAGPVKLGVSMWASVHAVCEH